MFNDGYEIEPWILLICDKILLWCSLQALTFVSFMYVSAVTYAGIVWL
jgi:hypothetical protein